MTGETLLSRGRLGGNRQTDRLAYKLQMWRPLSTS